MKKDIDIDKLKAGESIDEIPSLVTDEEKNILIGKIHDMLSEDVRTLVRLRKFGDPEKLIENNAGVIYKYLQDQKICEKCEGGLSKCPKDSTGFKKELVLDDNKKDIRIQFSTCSYLDDLNKNLSLIKVCAVQKRDIYAKAVKFLDVIDSNAETMKNLQKVFNKLLLLENTAHKNSIVVNYLPVKDSNLAESLLGFACYYFAQNGKSCSYLKPYLFENVTSFDIHTSEFAVTDLEQACSSDAVFFSDFSNLPFINEESKKLLSNLLESRLMTGRSIFFVSDKDPIKTLKKVFAGDDRYTNLVSRISDIIVNEKIVDFLI